jgi:hypothetical protein
MRQAGDPCKPAAPHSQTPHGVLHATFSASFCDALLGNDQVRSPVLAKAKRILKWQRKHFFTQSALD